MHLWSTLGVDYGSRLPWALEGRAEVSDGRGHDRDGDEADKMTLHFPRNIELPQDFELAFTKPFVPARRPDSEGPTLVVVRLPNARATQLARALELSYLQSDSPSRGIIQKLPSLGKRSKILRYGL